MCFYFLKFLFSLLCLLRPFRALVHRSVRLPFTVCTEFFDYSSSASLYQIKPPCHALALFLIYPPLLSFPFLSFPFSFSFFFLAVIGVMITASHNPEPDNGVKVVDPYETNFPRPLRFFVYSVSSQFGCKLSPPLYADVQLHIR